MVDHTEIQEIGRRQLKVALCQLTKGAVPDATALCCYASSE